MCTSKWIHQSWKRNKNNKQATKHKIPNIYIELWNKVCIWTSIRNDEIFSLSYSVCKCVFEFIRFIMFHVCVKAAGFLNQLFVCLSNLTTEQKERKEKSRNQTASQDLNISCLYVRHNKCFAHAFNYAIIWATSIATGRRKAFPTKLHNLQWKSCSQHIAIAHWWCNARRFSLSIFHYFTSYNVRCAQHNICAQPGLRIIQWIISNMKILSSFLSNTLILIFVVSKSFRSHKNEELTWSHDGIDGDCGDGGSGDDSSGYHLTLATFSLVKQ